MARRLLLGIAGWALVALAAGCASEDTAAPAAPPMDPPEATVRPNILLVIADDMGLDAASFDPQDPCYAAGEVSNDGPMPNVAELCHSGLRFTQAWAMPTCSPTRAAILTGRLPMRTQVGSALRLEDGDALPSTELALPRAMALGGSGYDMAHIGKWHLSGDPDSPGHFGWPHFAGPAMSLASYQAWTRLEDGVLSEVEGAYITSVQIDDALTGLDDRGEAPWLLWLALSAPHDPYHLPPADLHDAAALGEFTPGSDPRPWFAAMGTAMDTELGRLFDGLRARGEWENTVVIFVGDNGTDRPVVDPPFDPERAKGTLYEAGVHVPLVIAGPAVADGPRDVDHLVSVVDLFPTVLELAGVDVAAAVGAHAGDHSLDGVSALPYLTDAAAPPQRTHLVAQTFQDTPPIAEMNHAIRDGSHKLVCTPTSVELYDLQTDPLELRDLYEPEPEPGVQEVFTSLRDALVQRTGEPDLCALP